MRNPKENRLNAFYAELVPFASRVPITDFRIIDWDCKGERERKGGTLEPRRISVARSIIKRRHETNFDWEKLSRRPPLLFSSFHAWNGKEVASNDRFLSCQFSNTSRGPIASLDARVISPAERRASAVARLLRGSGGVASIHTRGLDTSRRVG